MAYLSPGVYITERDESTIVPTVSNNVAFFAADFMAGPVDQPFVITTRKELIERYGYPTDANYNEWFQASKFLDYANQLIVTRGFEEAPKYDSSSESALDLSLGDTTPLKVGEYIKNADGSVSLKLGMGKLFDIPKIQPGDVVGFSNAKNQRGPTTHAAIVASITDDTSGIGNEITVKVTFEGGKNSNLPGLDQSTPAKGEMWLFTYGHKNGKSYALGRGAPIPPQTGPNGRPLGPVLYPPVGASKENLDFMQGSKSFSDNRLASDYPLIKNHEEWDYMNTKLWEDTEVNPLRTWVSSEKSKDPNQPDLDILGKLNFFTRTPTTDKVQVAIANFEDFVTLYDQKTGSPYNYSVAFVKKVGKLREKMYLTDLFQYYPNKQEVALVFKCGEKVETFVVGFDPLGLDGNGKSNYIETVVNERSKLLYVLDNTNNPNLPATYLVSDRYGADWDDTQEKFIPRNDAKKSQYGVATDTLTVQGGKAPKISKRALRDAYFTVEDKEKYEIDVVIGNERAPEAAQELADSRKDCIAFVGARYEDTVGKKALDATNAIVRYITEEDPTQRDKSRMGPKLQRTMFSAYFGNYFKIFDTYNKKHRWINVAGDMAGIRCSVTTENASWWVSAGMRRGIINGIERMAFTPSLPMRDQLYKNSINPLVTFPGTGNLVWGNKTMQAYASAFDRINVRNMFSTIERAMAKAAKSQLFEFNDPYTRNAILSMFNPYLATIKAGRGLVDFLVICDESNNTPDVISRNELRVDIYVKPNYAAEFIILNFINVGTRSFAEVIGA